MISIFATYGDPRPLSTTSNKLIFLSKLSRTATKINVLRANIVNVDIHLSAHSALLYIYNILKIFIVVNFYFFSVKNSNAKEPNSQITNMSQILNITDYSYFLYDGQYYYACIKQNNLDFRLWNLETDEIINASGPRCTVPRKMLRVINPLVGPSQGQGSDRLSDERNLQAALSGDLSKSAATFGDGARISSEVTSEGLCLKNFNFYYKIRRLDGAIFKFFMIKHLRNIKVYENGIDCDGSGGHIYAVSQLYDVISGLSSVSLKNGQTIIEFPDESGRPIFLKLFHLNKITWSGNGIIIMPANSIIDKFDKIDDKSDNELLYRYKLIMKNIQDVKKSAP